MQTLRDYQVRARDELRAAVARLRDSNRPQRVLLDLPTGGGKTTVAAALIDGAIQRGGDVLFVAHRKELIDQCSIRLDDAGIDHGILMASHPRAAPWARVQVASVPTLARRLDHLPKATLIIVDEAHHARASTYTHVLDRYPGVPVIGLTATPWRLDNCGLGELFEEIVIAATMRELIAAGHLVPFTGFAYDLPDLAQVRKTGGDYNADEAAKAMSGKIVGNVVEQWQQHCGNKRTIVFATNVRHSMELVERFRAAGIAAEHVDGTSPKEEREGVLRRLSTGETTVVCNVNVLTEGFDCPAVENIVLARPTLSLVLYLQMIGRGMRPSPGKTVCRLHDHAGLIVRHGLPDQERDHSLLGDGNKGSGRGDPIVVLRRCGQCFAMFAGDQTACPQCGKAYVPKPRFIHEAEGSPVPIEQLRQQADERQYFLELQLSIARATGKKPGWAAARYKAKYGTWPSKEFWTRTKRIDPARVAKINERLKQIGGTK